MTRHTPETAEAARACHILYIGEPEMGRAQRLLMAVQTAPVLTVSDAPDFVNHGGDIAFVREGNRVRFDVNIADAQRGGLVISSRLLRLARRVSPSSQETIARTAHALNAILGWTRMLTTGVIPPQAAQRALGKIERNAAALTRLVEDIETAERGAYATRGPDLGRSFWIRHG